MMGNSLDELGKSAEAIAVYSDAAKANPSIELLHYNLGISLSRAGKKSEARHALQTALHLAPNHASAHAALASVYRDMGYRIPAALAYSRFLTLEPESARAVNALPILQSLLLGGVSATDSSHISIAVQRDKKGAEEGDFGPAEIAVSISVAANIMAKPALAEHQKSSAFDQMVAVYSIPR